MRRWEERLTFDIPQGSQGAQALRSITAELLQRPAAASPSSPSSPRESSADSGATYDADVARSRDSGGFKEEICLGRAEIDSLYLLQTGAGTYQGWFELSNGAASLHLSLHFVAAAADGDESDDEKGEFLPVNAVMLRIYWDRLLCKRAWLGWRSNFDDGKRLRDLLKGCVSTWMNRMLHKAFETWWEGTIALAFSHMAAPEEGRGRQRSRDRRRRSSGYGSGYESARQEAAMARLSAEREQREAAERARRWEPAPGTLLFPHNHKGKAERRRRSLAKYAEQGRQVPRPHQIIEDLEDSSEQHGDHTVSRLRVMGAVWPAAWAEKEVSSLAYRLEEQAISFWHGHVLAQSFSLWHTHAVRGGALRYAAARRVSVLLRVTLRRWRGMARDSRELFFARAWYEEHSWHWIAVGALKRWRETAAWLGYSRRATHVGRRLGLMRMRGRLLSCWRQVTVALRRLREGSDALCWERRRGRARRMLRAWASWSGGQALLDGRAGAAAAAADLAEQVKAARADGGVAALVQAEAAAKTEPIVHCFLTGLGQPRIVATRHHPLAVARAGRNMWMGSSSSNSSGGDGPSGSGLELPRKMRLAVLALPVRCWREWLAVRREVARKRSVARAHCDVLRVFCALRAWATLLPLRREGSSSSEDSNAAALNPRSATAIAGANARASAVAAAGGSGRGGGVSLLLRTARQGGAGASVGTDSSSEHMNRTASTAASGASSSSASSSSSSATRKSRVEGAAERVWYMFWRNRMRCELQLDFVTRQQWDRFWALSQGLEELI